MNSKLTTDELVALAEDMMSSPERYGITEEQIHQWALNDINRAANVLDRIPESLRDELSDGIISAYTERKKKGLV